jgi:hypothetical protein
MNFVKLEQMGFILDLNLGVAFSIPIGVQKRFRLIAQMTVLRVI